MNKTSEDRLAQVNPLLASKIRLLAADTLREGFEIEVIQGLRSIAYQDSLYAEGRTTLSPVGCVHAGKVFRPGLCPHHPFGVPVTNARGGQSYHNFGLAVDCAPIDRLGKIDWNASHPQWKRMEDLGVSLGLVSGARWAHLVDAPHFQLTGAFPIGAPNEEVMRLATELPVLWSEVNKSYGA